MRRTRWTRCLLAPALASALCACGTSDTAMATDDPGATHPSPERLYRQNPVPRQPYEVTLTLADAPGPFAAVDWRAQYDIVNQACLPPPSRISGAQTEPASTSPAIAFRKLSDTTYVATVYADLMIEEDIYGRGVCRWRLVGTHVRLRASGAPGETQFMAWLPAQLLHSQKARTTYFWSGGYPRDDMNDYPDAGTTDLSKYKPNIRAQTFSVTLLPRKAEP